MLQNASRYNSKNGGKNPKNVQESMMDIEVSEMLKKESISLVQDQENFGEVFVQSFSSRKKQQGQHLVKNLKQLNKNVPYKHFKMEGFRYLKFMLQQRIIFANST